MYDVGPSQKSAFSPNSSPSRSGTIRAASSDVVEPQVTRRSTARSAQPTLEPAANQAHALRWLVGLLTIAALATLSPILGAARLGGVGGHHCLAVAAAAEQVVSPSQLVAGAFTTLLLLAILTPLVICALSLSASAVALAQKLMASQSGADALKALSGQGGAGFDLHASLQHLDLKRMFELLRQHGTRALGAASSAFGAVSVVVIGVVIFVAGFYSFLTEGRKLHAWLLESSPLSHPSFHRLANVFVEVGRGLLVGVGLTALAQGAVATIGYLVRACPKRWCSAY